MAIFMVVSAKIKWNVTEVTFCCHVTTIYASSSQLNWVRIATALLTFFIIKFGVWFQL